MKPQILPSSRVATNTMASYLRTVVATALSLISTRWVLEGLGLVDFGLYAMLSAITVFVTVLNQVLATSVSRQLAYTLGASPEDLHKWFNSALGLHLIFALVLTSLGLILGNLAIDNWLNLDTSQIDRAHIVFNLLLFFSALGMVYVPYSGVFQAHQRFPELAAWGVLQSLAGFFLAMGLHYQPFDTLIYFATGNGCIALLYNLAIFLRARSSFSMVKINASFWFDWQRVRSLFSFLTWSTIGSIGAALRNQGAAVLLGTSSGPTVATAYGIANQVATQTNQMTNALVGALTPSLSVLAGKKADEKLRQQALQAGFLATHLTMAFVVPLWLELRFALGLWLGAPPPGAEALCSIIMATFLVEKLTTGNQIAIAAKGRIAMYQATTGTSLLLAFPALAILLAIGLDTTESVAVAFLSSAALMTIFRLIWGVRLVEVSIGSWVKSVLAPALTTFVLASTFGLLCRNLFTEGLLRLVLVILTTSLVVGSSLLFHFRATRSNR